MVKRNLIGITETTKTKTVILKRNNSMDNKITICRSFTRKVNLGNLSKKFMYEAVDFFASYSEEFDKEGMTKEIAKTQSNKLSEMAKLDVESAIDKFLYDLIRKDKEESEGTEKFSK